jgi:hypothetical protein
LPEEQAPPERVLAAAPARAAESPQSQRVQLPARARGAPLEMRRARESSQEPQPAPQLSLEVRSPRKVRGAVKPTRASESLAALALWGAAARPLASPA